MNKNIFLPLLCSILFLSFFLQAYSLYIGYHLKFFMIMIPLSYIMINNSLYLDSKLYLHEKLLLITIISFSSTTLYSYNISSSLRMVFGLLILIILYWMLISTLKAISKNIILRTLLYAGIIFNISSILLYLTGLIISNGDFTQRAIIYGLMIERNTPRLIGTMTDPNFFSAYNNIFIFLSIFYYKKISISKPLLLLAIINTLLTFSIGGYIALFFGSVGLIFHTKNKLKFLFNTVSIICITLLTVYIFFPQYIEQVQHKVMVSLDGSGRFKDWGSALMTFYDNPFGIGIFTFLEYNGHFYAGTHYTHNTYLDVLVEGGIITFLFYMLFLLSFLRKSYSNSNVFLFPVTIAILISFLSLSAFLNEYWLLILALLHRLSSCELNEKTLNSN
ncbi:hypothetical protein MOMOMM108M1_14640 [Morganella morganii]